MDDPILEIARHLPDGDVIIVGFGLGIAVGLRYYRGPLVFRFGPFSIMIP